MLKTDSKQLLVGCFFKQRCPTWIILVGSTIKKRQRLNEITEVIKSVTPGVVGAASGVVYTRGHWLKRIANIFVSSATVYYTYEYVASITGLPGGMVSFFLGLFAAPTIEVAMSELYEFKPLKAWLTKKGLSK